MSERINNFTDNLRNQLNSIDDRLIAVKLTMDSAAGETQATIESKLDEVKNNLKMKRDEFNQYREQIKELEKEAESEVRSKVEEWKTTREVKKLNRRADRAENDAASRVFLAVACMDEAEASILEAISARLDADHALKVELHPLEKRD